jgi:hypothetical protein
MLFALPDQYPNLGSGVPCSHASTRKIPSPQSSPIDSSNMYVHTNGNAKPVSTTRKRGSVLSESSLGDGAAMQR